MNSRPNPRQLDSRTSLNHNIVEQETYQLFMENVIVILVHPDSCGCGILTQPQCPSQRRMKTFVDGHFIKSIRMSPWFRSTKKSLGTAAWLAGIRVVSLGVIRNCSTAGQTLHSSVRFQGEHSVITKEHNPTKQHFSQAHEQLYSSLKTKTKQKTLSNFASFKGLQSSHLWEFVRDLLLSPEENCGILEWEDREQGIFRVVKSEALAKMWGQRKKNDRMTYEKLSRALR